MAAHAARRRHSMDAVWIEMVRMLNFLCLRSDQESGNLMLKAIGFWFCFCRRRAAVNALARACPIALACLSRMNWDGGLRLTAGEPFFLRPQKEWPSDRERLEWHKRLISNPFGSKMVPHCITTSAFNDSNAGWQLWTSCTIPYTIHLFAHPTGQINSSII